MSFMALSKLHGMKLKEKPTSIWGTVKFGDFVTVAYYFVSVSRSSSPRSKDRTIRESERLILAHPYVDFDLQELNAFSQLLQETEHFCRWHQKKVAKIVP